jgi:membrane protease YdiL (CAAX protease family)
MPRTSFFKEMPPYAKLMLSVGFILLSLIICSVLSLALSVVIYHVKMDALLDPLNNIKEPGVFDSLNLMQTISGIGTFIIPAFFLAFLMSENTFDFLKLNRMAAVNSFLLVALMILTMLPFINWLAEMNGRMALPSFLHGVERWMRKSEDDNAELTKYFLDMHSTQAVVFNVIMIGLIPAIGEELLFRGIIQRLFIEWTKNKHVAIFITAALFSAIHIQFYGFIPRMLLGVLFGYLVVWSGSLWLAICGHFINNASAVIFTYLFRNDLSKIDPDTIGTEGTQWIATVVSGVLIIVTMILIKKIEERRNQIHPLIEQTLNTLE